MKLSLQAQSAIMMALTNSLLHQTDISPVLDGFQLEMRDGELFVLNPPTVKQLSEEELTSLENEVQFVGTED